MWTTKISNEKLSKGTMAICSTFLNQQEKQKMNGLWEKANEVSEVGYKVHSAAMVVELIATSIADNAESGAAWAVVDMLENLSDKLDRLASEIMTMNRQHEEQEIKSKKKKK
jgi:hypothetical protein